VLCRIYKKNGHSQRVQGAERDESPSADEVMTSLPNIEQQNKLQLPKLGPFSGLLETDDPFIEGLLNDEAMDGNGNISRLPHQVHSSDLSHNNFSNSNDNNSDCQFEVFPKQEALAVDNENKFNSLKRTLSLAAFGDEEIHSAKRFNDMQNNYSYNVNNNVSALLNSMQPNQTFQQQNFLSALSDSQQNFRLPYIQNMHWSS